MMADGAARACYQRIYKPVWMYWSGETAYVMDLPHVASPVCVPACLPHRHVITERRETGREQVRWARCA